MMKHVSFRQVLLPLSVTTLIVACADTKLPADEGEDGKPAAMLIVGGNAQVDTVGQQLRDPLVIRVVDKDGNPVVGQVVNFVVTSGGGSVFAGVANTDSLGEARELWTLGTVAGEEQSVEARAVDTQTGEPSVFATFKAIGVPDSPASVRVAAATGPDSTKLLGTLPVGDSIQLVALVSDQHSNPILDLTLSWGSSDSSVAVPAADGLVNTFAPGPVEMTAQAETATGALTFRVGLALIASYDAGIQVDRLVLSHSDNRLHIGGWSGGGSTGQGFQILDVSDPTSPQPLGGLSLSAGTVHFIRISASEDIAYVGSISDGLLIIDVTIPANPVLVGSYNPGFNSVNDFAVTVDGSIGFLAAGDHGLLVLDLGDPLDPRLMATYEVSTNCTINSQPVFSGNCSAGGVALTSDETTVFVASAWGGTKILDVRQPNLPRLISTIPAGPSTMGKIVLSMDERTAYIVGSGGGGGLPFRTFDLSDLTAPLLLGSYTNEFGGYSAIELSMDEETVYLGGINIGLEILDVTDTTAPKLRASFKEVINESAPRVLGIDVTLDETIGFLAGNIDGLRVVRTAAN